MTSYNMTLTYQIMAYHIYDMQYDLEMLYDLGIPYDLDTDRDTQGSIVQTRGVDSCRSRDSAGLR